MISNRMLAAASAAFLLAAPSAAIAKKPEDKGGKGKGPKTVSFVLKGTYAGEGAVDVVKANGPAKKAGFVGQTVTLDFAAAKVVVDDVNADGVRDLADVQVGDMVVVKVTAPRGAKPGDALSARKLVDQTHKADSDDDDADDAPEAPEAPEVESSDDD